MKSDTDQQTPDPLDHLKAPAPDPALEIVLQYGGPNKYRGTSYAIGDQREHVTYALPFAFPLAGTEHVVVPPSARHAPPTSRMGAMIGINVEDDSASVIRAEEQPQAPVVTRARMNPTFACPLCRIAGEMSGADSMADVVSQSVKWAWSFLDDEGARAGSWVDAIEHAQKTFAVAVEKAIEHMKQHGVAAEWHTADVMESFPGTAYGAVVLRGLGPAQRPSGTTRITATSVLIHKSDFSGELFELWLLADRAAGRSGRQAIIAKLHDVRSDGIYSREGVTTYEARLDGPITVDSVAVTELPADSVLPRLVHAPPDVPPPARDLRCPKCGNALFRFPAPTNTPTCTTCVTQVQPTCTDCGTAVQPAERGETLDDLPPDVRASLMAGSTSEDRGEPMTLTNDPEEARNSGTRADGQQNKYVVLSDEERAKGFVRPVRHSYKHVGIRPTCPTRDLTAEEIERFSEYGYVKFEAFPCSVIVDPGGTTPACGYPSTDERHVEGPGFLHEYTGPNGSAATGRYWTAAQFVSGCGAVTTMAQPIAETYARKPDFYTGTFCVGCGKHLPVGEHGEFVWVDDGTRVGT